MAANPQPTSSETPNSTPGVVEQLLGSLEDVGAVRVMAGADGLVRTVEVQARKEAPRGLTEKIGELLESEFDLTLDPGQLLVTWPTDDLALTPWAGSTPESPTTPRVPDPRSRFLYRGRTVEPQGENKVTVRVVLEWDGDLYEGTVEAMEAVKARFEASAEATLRAMQLAAAASGARPADSPPLTLDLTGIKVVQAFGQEYVLIGVEAQADQNRVRLAGTTGVGRDPERAAVLATLQAADRWVRGRLL
jgi:hypothetical protein